MKEFRDRVAVVTGAASGIGRGLAGRFAAEGMKLVLADVEEDALRQAEAEFREKGVDVLGVRTDVSKSEDIEKLAQETLDAFGAVHVLCNNAGVVSSFSLVDSSLKDWEWVMGVNLWGVIHGVRVSLPIMMKQDTEAHIVNTASLAGVMGGGGIYGVTKQGVVALTESLYHELASAGSKVKVSVLCPGWVNTQIIEADRNRPDELKNAAEPPIDPQRAAMREMVRNFLKTGQSPAEIADKVFEAITEERLYILTHPEMNGIISTRMENILAQRNPAPQMLGG
jgi:NAD(P)-dependent dehydrogenase (short-subunit alcohol dehydrogenase family)